MTREILNFENDRMICNVLEDNTINHADLDLSEAAIEVYPISYLKSCRIAPSCDSY